MLEIKNITKVYDTGGFRQKALDNVSISFRNSEFVSILGPSGSGKTTLLNIVGGLDHYTDGDLIINCKSTKKYKDSDWDSYRNHRIGFVFQSYNLITHQTILSNVKLALTLSGISKKEANDRAYQALCDVGLKEHVNKRPNQLSGGQMQRVAIARALVNNPDIILADEPTGALDSGTSIQIMELLKKISKDKLVIMVTHNPDLAEKYSSRIIELRDGKIVGDSKPLKKIKNNSKYKEKNYLKKISMSFITALALSFNNLMTKKKRTILVSFAGSIGIIGIALILAVSNGFHNYVDSIQENTLTSYPLTIMQESTDIAGMLLSMQSKNGDGENKESVKEEQYISSMLSNVRANDLKSLKRYINENYSEIEKDISNIQYYYNVDPNIYTIDVTNKLAKVNPNNLFTMMMGNNSLMSSYSMMGSVFSQIVDDTSDIIDDYQVLAGRWPEKYDEMIIVLSEPGSISDLLIYSLGLRDNNELTSMISGIMSGEGTDIKNKPLTLTYDDLMSVDLRLIMPTDTYKYNSKYGIYEDMHEDNNYMMNLYNKALKLKIVGIVTTKSGVNSSALSPGVNYTSGLINYIVNYTGNSDIVKKQLVNSNIDVFSGARFDEKNKNNGLDFANMISVDNNMLQSAFNMNIPREQIVNNMNSYYEQIKKSLTNDIKMEIVNIRTDVSNSFRNLADGLFKYINGEVDSQDISEQIDDYLNSDEAKEIINNLSEKYEVASETLQEMYKNVLEKLISDYEYLTNDEIDQEKDFNDKVVTILDDYKEKLINKYSDDVLVESISQNVANFVVNRMVKAKSLEQISAMSNDMIHNMANSFRVDEAKLAKAFKINVTEEEMMRVIGAMVNNNEKSIKSNLSTLGYQDIEDPTFIAVYFSSFDGKDHFLTFLNNYNKKVSEDKQINFSDTTGILMSSVKTIVDAVSYVLIAFVSISLVVSSIMIGIITYISVYERTKEIGILRSIGASKHNISSIFNAETFIIGLLSGLFGIGITYILIPIINAILHHYTGNIPLNASLAFINAIILIILSIILTIIGGLIPAGAASRKDPVEALRSE